MSRKTFSAFVSACPTAGASLVLRSTLRQLASVRNGVPLGHVAFRVNSSQRRFPCPSVYSNGELFGLSIPYHRFVRMSIPQMQKVHIFSIVAFATLAPSGGGWGGQPRTPSKGEVDRGDVYTPAGRLFRGGTLFITSLSPQFLHQSQHLHTINHVEKLLVQPYLSWLLLLNKCGVKL